jgi:hypothetical protein
MIFFIVRILAIANVAWRLDRLTRDWWRKPARREIAAEDIEALGTVH